MRKKVPFHWSLYILLILVLSDCISQSDKISNSSHVKVLDVNLKLSNPSYKDFFETCEIIKLDSDPQSVLSWIDKVICINDSNPVLDRSKSNVFLFSSDGSFLNGIGTKGEGPEDYYLCYDFVIHPESRLNG